MRSFARKTFEFEKRFRMCEVSCFILFILKLRVLTAYHGDGVPAKGGRHAEEIEIWVWPSSS